mmetsp:Transcript_24805/g.72678  ORF Transcript_24805/g.72678 Transcript_24805/m.72678 type:complete len:435 (-) Transcript_24805:259-1563(-)
MHVLCNVGIYKLQEALRVLPRVDAADGPRVVPHRPLHLPLHDLPHCPRLEEVDDAEVEDGPPPVPPSPQDRERPPVHAAHAGAVVREGPRQEGRHRELCRHEEGARQVRRGGRERPEWKEERVEESEGRPLPPRQARSRPSDCICPSLRGRWRGGAFQQGRRLLPVRVHHPHQEAVVHHAALGQERDVPPELGEECRLGLSPYVKTVPRGSLPPHRLLSLLPGLLDLPREVEVLQHGVRPPRPPLLDRAFPPHRRSLEIEPFRDELGPLGGEDGVLNDEDPLLSVAVVAFDPHPVHAADPRHEGPPCVAPPKEAAISGQHPQERPGLLLLYRLDHVRAVGGEEEVPADARRPLGVGLERYVRPQSVHGTAVLPVGYAEAGTEGREGFGGVRRDARRATLAGTGASPGPLGGLSLAAALAPVGRGVLRRVHPSRR